MLHNKLILGTAQIGMDYGINNKYGKIPTSATFDILDFAFSNGVLALETAEDYGDALDIIGKYQSDTGNYFNIIVKSNLNDNKTYSIDLKIKNFIKILSLDNLDSFSFHSFTSLIKNEKVFENLIQLKDQGFIKNIGVSIYDNIEFERVINYDDIDIIQIPFNLLDNYSKRGPLIELAKIKGKLIHARSTFLQGLFYMDYMKLSKYFRPIVPFLKEIKNICRVYGLSTNELAIGYVNSFDNIDGIIIGIDKKQHLDETIQSAKNKISPNVIEKINRMEMVDDSFLNPMSWK